MMMRRTSPPKHRHDGTSPLPLGMDWSPPPKRWNGPNALWPHDPHTGWSYCITVPSWVALPMSRSSSDPVVFYRVQVGVQSPYGITSTRAVLRRFNDFLKLFSDLKRAFPKKNLPPTPPKGLMRMKSVALLDERRCSLEEWMTKLLCDIDISRSVAIASFLELEAAARSSFQNATQQPLVNDPDADMNSSLQYVHGSSRYQALGGSSSLASHYGSDTVYETSDLGSPSLGIDDSSEVGMEGVTLDDEMSNPIEQLVKYGMSNIDEGLLMAESILDELRSIPRHKVLTKSITDNGICSNDAHTDAGRINNINQQPTKEIGHTRKPLDESVGSDLSTYKGSEMSNFWPPNLLSEAILLLPGCSEASVIMGSPPVMKSKSRNGAEVIIAVDQGPKLDRLLITMQRRVNSAKTDMEDLLTCLNQESAVKEYLTTKADDLEVELKTTKQKTKENLQQAVLIEKKRLTKLQWDMEELRQKSMKMELKLKSQEEPRWSLDGQLCMNSTSAFSSQEKYSLSQTLDTTREQFNSLLKQHEELEVKSKSDIRILVKEVKSLRRSQYELKQQHDQLLQENSILETLLQQERHRNEESLAARRKLLHECESLCIQLQDCNIKFLNDDSSIVDALAVPNILDVLAKSDNQIGRVFAEVQHFASNGGSLSGEVNNFNVSGDLGKMDNELRKILKDVITDTAKLRKKVNVFIRSATTTSIYRESGSSVR